MLLTLSRMAGESIMLGDDKGECLATVQSIRGQTVSLIISQALADKPGRLVVRTPELQIDQSVTIHSFVTVTLVDVREEKARIAINAPKETSIHRLEVYEAIKRENERRGDDFDSDSPGSAPVPRPRGPMPPSLDVRLDEPADEE